ncbi:MAG: type II toxin-antitoxin system HicA family toxin [Chloroflexi bacterium]|nr:type II toxin-antitoxin system HicA family toxin [Chloroflexota bacterium]MDA1272057.1 type II toxin-antitoxin system HicA family toxin [Chloroflexota bacterium]
MSTNDRILSRVLGGASDSNIPFNHLRQLLLRLGFEERVRDSHPIFRKNGVDERINLQRDGSKAKVYQVRQVRAMILKYGYGHEG